MDAARVAGYRARVRLVVALVGTLFAQSTSASPNVSLDDPRYEELARRYVLGELPAYTGGLLPLTERRVESLLGHTRQPERWWFAPVTRLRLTATLFDDDPRPYSTDARPRDLTVGGISIACERREGLPCGDGAGAFAEVESSAGYGDWVSATIRLRAQAGESYAESLVLDRGYVNAELGPVAAQIGRDVITFGPTARTQPGWGTNAPPLTHVRVSTSEPFQLTSNVRLDVDYVLGVLRAPQRFPHNLVSIGRMQLDISDGLEIGAMQLLQLGGDGARALGFWGFIAEHVRRSDPSAGPTDSSNRRFGGDIALRITELRARLYYAVVFEDIRAKRLVDAVRYDADHVIGIEMPALGSRGEHGATIEWQRTGFRSQEHRPRTTGFTHMGRLVGSPLGPDATSIFACGRIELGWSKVYLWAEAAKLASDTYRQVVYGPIDRLTHGPAETRYRGGLRVRVPLQHGIVVEGEALAEHVAGFAFEPGMTRNNLGIITSLTWDVRAPIGIRN